jgi:hypothetical protein
VKLTVPARQISLVAVASSGSCGDAGQAVIAAPLSYEGREAHGTSEAISLVEAASSRWSHRSGKYDRRNGDALRVA